MLRPIVEKIKETKNNLYIQGETYIQLQNIPSEGQVKYESVRGNIIL